jgi:hypothetical protein
MDDQVIGYTPDAQAQQRRKDTDEVERARADRPAVKSLRSATSPPAASIAATA